MKNVLMILKKEPMLTVSILAALVSLLITPPSAALLADIDWRTLGTLFMMLTILEGFKKEDIFLPVIRLSGRFRTTMGLSFFLIFGVFFASMFVTNDVSLLIFVPLTILLLRSGDREQYILPVLAMENIAAVRGSMLTPFGSPQNLFLFGHAGVSAGTFLLHMFPLWALSALLLAGFILILYRGSREDPIALSHSETSRVWSKDGRVRRVMYLVLFVLILLTIVTRTNLWPGAVALVLLAVLIFDPKILLRTDYVLLLTFLCFFVFSSSVTSNPAVSGFLSRAVAGQEYWWGIGLSQLISNVPAAIVLYPFTENLPALLYGVDSAGLCTLIGSLASVINYRIYVREYPGRGGQFIRSFTLISLAFFALVVIPGWLLSHWPM